ncbi:MAG TPA: CvpA family protein [Candidatus Dormibacteraeota bacterium]|nr:CvpA family protein [Candidatus Dormibacteraeota bacterium]
MSFGWPDIVIGAILAIATIRGWRRGLIGELAGAIALFAGLVAPWYYNGAADGAIGEYTHVGPGSAHVIGMFLTGIAAYAIVIALAWALNRIAKLPGLGIINSSVGALIALGKGVIFLWLLLYVALFFPLSPDIRRDLGRSALVAILVHPDAGIDAAVQAHEPWFARPFSGPLFKRHRL